MVMLLDYLIGKLINSPLDIKNLLIQENYNRAMRIGVVKEKYIVQNYIINLRRLASGFVIFILYYTSFW